MIDNTPDHLAVNFSSHLTSERDALRAFITLLENEQQALLLKATKNLSDEDNLLITLFYHGNNSIEDISSITGLSASNVKVRLHRIRKKLYNDMNAMMAQRLN